MDTKNTPACLPALPHEISPDGREVWDWAERLGTSMARAQRQQELTAAISEGQRTCGSCSKWMTDACPRETRDSRGRKTGGPSCKSLKCSQFAMQEWDRKRIEDLQSELDAITKATGASHG